MTREDVFKEISKERDYQDSCVSPVYQDKSGVEGAFRALPRELQLIRVYLRRAEELDAFQPQEKALAAVRAIAAISVRCLERFGCPSRQPECAIQEHIIPDGKAEHHI